MKKKKLAKKQNSIVNRRASFDYVLGDELTVGMVLGGKDVRAARDGLVQLKGSYVSIKENEMWLNNASFSLKINEKGGESKAVDTSPRKLLASKKQIEALELKRKSGMSIVPLRLLNRGKYIKLVIALGKGKKKYDKRESLKRRQTEKETNRALRGKYA